MSESVAAADLDQALKSATDFPALRALKKRVYADKDLHARAEELAKEWEGASSREAVCLFWILNRHAHVVEARTTDALVAVLKGRSYLAQNRIDEAAGAFAEGDKPFGALGAAETTLVGGDAAAAKKALDKLTGKHADEPELHYLLGRCLDRLGDYADARAAYEQALELDDEFAPALFRLAYNENLRGDDDVALELYERCAKLQPTYVHALLNLGVLYDDRGSYDKAIECFRQVLDANPTHQRARLFLKDSQASLDMYFDEDQARRADRQNLILSIPVTDFELSVRSRNCLNKMNIKTLGDLVEKTEAELLSYKNFGETSLMEIKEILAKKGLKLGMGREALANPSQGARTAVEALIGGAGPAASSNPNAARPLTDFDLSVRVRTAMRNLAIHSLGDLSARTSRELLSCKNFGQTSLEEVRNILHKHNLSLADEPSPS